MPSRKRFAEATHHQQRIVDTQPKAQHGGKVLHQDGQMHEVRQETCKGQRRRNGKLADCQRYKRGNQAPERQQQQRKRYRDYQGFAAPHVFRACPADVKIERDLARKLDRYRRIPRSQLRLQRAGQLMKLRHQRLNRAILRGKPHKDERSTALTHENRVAQLQVRSHS
jgi:hypothetical protein